EPPAPRRAAGRPADALSAALDLDLLGDAALASAAHQRRGEPERPAPPGSARDGGAGGSRESGARRGGRASAYLRDALGRGDPHRRADGTDGPGAAGAGAAGARYTRSSPQDSGGARLPRNPRVRGGGGADDHALVR